MREIPLSRGMVALVDDEDYEELSRYKWSAQYCKRRGTYIAVRATSRKSGKKMVLMHRQIMGLEHGDRRVVDHISVGDTLDNRRSNLRIATNSENMCNSGIRPQNKSGYKGVFWSGVSQKWTAQIRKNYTKYHLGLFETPEAAHAAYCAAAERLHGEFAKVA